MTAPYKTQRERWRRMIFGTDTPAGRAFDVLLIIAILLSVLAVMLASVEGVRAHWGHGLVAIEWFFTVVFTIEYLARLWTVREPLRYAESFFGVVDVLALLPTY